MTPKIVLLIGDGMGRGQLDATSLYKTGSLEQLHMFQLPARGIITTSSSDGITDSAAAATAMASGVFTHNGQVGTNATGIPVQNLVELAKAYGMSTGLVSTTRIAHATPAAFSAHVPSRNQYEEIAKQMASLGPDVILGGGAVNFEDRSDCINLSEELAGIGYQVVHSSSELAKVSQQEGKLLGLFADGEIPYVIDRTKEDDTPTLSEMALVALHRLNANPRGFLLMIEGGRIDHAGHANDIHRVISETLAFDDCVQSVANWAQKKKNVSIIVTADHETGGLQVVNSSGVGQIPTVVWRWGSHTNATIQLFAKGPGSQSFDGVTRDHRWIHSTISSLISGIDVSPSPALSPNGHLEDLAGPAVTQTHSNPVDPSNQLTRLVLAEDSQGLGIGLEGLFRVDRGATIVLIDVDYGMGTGLRSIDSVVDLVGDADRFLSGLSLPPSTDKAFAVDLAYLTIHGQESIGTAALPTVGLRGLRPPYGSSDSLGPMKVAANFSDHARNSGENQDVEKNRGLELYIPWSEIYPGETTPPPNAKIAVWAVQVHDDGSATNQSLPPWPTTPHGEAPAPLVITTTR